MKETKPDRTPRESLEDALTAPVAQVRARALSALRHKRFDIAEQLLETDDVSVRSLIENLRVYQAELEIQNEELMRSHGEVQEALMRFASLFQGLPVAGLVIDRQGLVKESNAEAQRLFNLEASHLRQHFFSRMIGEDDRGAVIGAWTKMPPDRPLTLEGIHFVDGSAAGFMGDLSIAALPESRDGQAQFVCTVIDRSESMRQRLALVETGARLSRSEASLKERLKERSALLDVLAETSQADQSFERTLQRVVERLPAAWRFPELAEAQIRLPGTRFQTDGFAPTPWSHSTRIPLASGETGEISIVYRKSPPSDADDLFLEEEQTLLDAVGHHVAVFVARHREEARLRESIEDFRVLAEHNPEWEYWLGTDGRYRYVSPACAAVTGYAVEDFLEDPCLFHRLVHPDDLAAWTRHAEDTVSGSHDHADATCLVLRLRTREGGIRWIEHICKPVISDDGRYLGRRGVNRDITERRAAETLAARMTGLYTALSHCSQAIVRSTDEATLLQEVCTIATAFEGIRVCVIALEQPSGTAPSIAAASGTSPELARLLAAAETPPRGRGDTPGAGATMEHLGLCASARYPLSSAGRTIGTMYLFAEESDFFAPDVARLLDEMAADVSFALDGFAQERARCAAETAVAERKQYLSAIFRSAQVGIGVSRDRIIRDANHYLCDLLGYERDALIGMETQSLYCDEAVYRDLGSRPTDLERGNLVHTIETQWRRRDGLKLDILLGASPLDMERPEHGMVFTVLDITERKGIRDALQRSQELLNATGRLAKVGGWELYPATERLNLTEVAREILELPDSHLAAMTDFVPLLDPRDRPKLQSATRQALSTGRPYDIQVRLARPGKIQPWVQLTCQPVVDDGQVERLVGAVQDITSRMEAEKSLRQAARVFESTAEGVVITDPDEHILAVNKAFTEITGYSEDEVLGETPRLLKSGRHHKSFYQTLWEELEQTGFWRGEIWNSHKNGDVYPELMTISAVLDDAGEVTHYVGVFRDITHIKRSEEQLAFLAHHDPLTGLPNRSLFQLRLEHCIQRAHRNGRKVALLFLDLDRFKVINDTLGHLFGDALLKQAAESLARQVRAEDTIARLGGDEFVIVLEEIGSVNDAAIFAERILTIFSRPFRIRERDLFVTASIGISIYPDDGKDLDTLLRHADIAMYRAKDLGRNAFALFEPSMTEGADDRFRLETDLRHAVERRQLALHYQPQIVLADRRLIGVEALCRWHHPELGAIPPSRFIPLAEDIGMIDQLGAWVLEESSRQLATWDRDGFRVPRLAVNLSMQQLESRELVDYVRSVLQTSEIDAQRLELEVTESMIMRDPERAVAALQELRSLGITLAVDDFGTGYSSLAYLKRLPLNRLKINRSFVEHLTTDSNDDAIVRAIIALGESLGLATIAEGVETREQADFLMEEGYAEVQGYLFGRPLPPDALASAWSGHV